MLLEHLTDGPINTKIELTIILTVFDMLLDKYAEDETDFLLELLKSEFEKIEWIQSTTQRNNNNKYYCRLLELIASLLLEMSTGNCYL